MSACLYVYVQCVCWVSKEAMRECWVPWTCSYSRPPTEAWVLGSKSRSSEEQGVPLTVEHLTSTTASKQFEIKTEALIFLKKINFARCSGT